MEDKSDSVIFSEMDGLADGLAGESCNLRDLVLSLRRVGNHELSDELSGLAAQLDLYQNDLRDYANQLANNRVKAAEQATQNMLSAALGRADTERN